MNEERINLDLYTDEDLEIMKQELVERHQELNTKLNMGSLTDEDREEWERVRVNLDEITKYQEEGKGFLDVEAEFRRLQEEVASLKENNVVGSKTATFEERLNYINRLQAIPKELDKLLENEALKKDSRTVNELREQIVSVRNDVLEYVKNQISQVVANQMKKLANIEKHAQRLFNELQHDFTALHDITEELNNLVAEFEEFKSELPNLRKLIAEQMNVDPYSVTESQLKSKVAYLAGILRDIKRAQINNYNNMVTILNESIRMLSLEVGLPQELYDKINGLEQLSRCGYPTRFAYNTVNYLKEMNYAKLIEMMKLANEISKEVAEFRGKGGQEQPGPGDGDDVPPVNPPDDEPSVETVLEAELRTIEESVYDLNDKCTPELDEETTKQFMETIGNLEKNIADFRLKLEENKDKLSEEKYRELNDRINAMENLLGIIKERITKKDKNENLGYMLFKQSVEFLKNRVDYEVDHLLESSFVDNKIPEAVFEHFMNRINGFENEIEALSNDIKNRFEAGELDKTQFDNLMEMLDEIKTQVAKGKEKIESFEIMKDRGFLDFLNGDLDSLERAIEEYGRYIEMLNAPIGRDNRKLLDAMYKSILDEIDRIEKNLEHMNEQEPDKYEAEMKRLDVCKEKLEAYNKKYRSKCPLMVKAWRSAKNWCKKHPKLAMIAAGLAAVALTHMIVGPVLIPAIMHGNILIANKVAFLRPLISGVNKLLGGAINASLVNTSINGVAINVWRLANGLMISPTITSGSLLKGIAMVAGASSVMVAPLVVGAKKLFGKMKKKENETVIEEKAEKEKVTDKIKGAVAKIPEKVKPKKKATLAMLKEYITLDTPEEKEKYFAKLTTEQKNELNEVLHLLETHKKEEANPLEEDKAEGRGR